MASVSTRRRPTGLLTPATRKAEPRSTTARVIATALVVALFLIAAPTAALASTSSFSGVVFKDLNRDGVKQSSEGVFTGQSIDLLDGGGRYLKSVKTDSTGRYTFSALANGDYIVRLRSYDWSLIRSEWVPSNTGSVWPRLHVAVNGSAQADLGWRRILSSSDLSTPISSVTAASGLRVESYNDAVTAREILSALESGGLTGDEAPVTTVRFGYHGTNTCPASVTSTNGVYGGYSAQCYVSYISWLDTHDAILFHEYGHAWAQYYAYIVQQDPTYTSYLEFRGLAGDPRLGTSHGWHSGEILAEDYRQLFGSSTAKQRPQENKEIALAADVPGLKEFLSTTFMGKTGSADPQPGPEPSPTASPSPAPTGTPTPTPAEPEAPAAPSEMHVGDLDAVVTSAKGGAWSARVSILVHDGTAPVAGATVSYAWSATSQKPACTTDSSGWCSVQSSLFDKSVRSADLTVTNVSHSSLTYTGANQDPDGDSDGTVISMKKGK